MASYRGIEFIDPISDQLCYLLLRAGDLPTVDHPECTKLADVSMALDAFYCLKCGLNGRISGAWVHELITAGR